MCPNCFNKYKKCHILKKNESQLELLQYRFQGYNDKDDYSFELAIDQDTYLLGLPINDQQLSNMFQQALKSSIYYQLGEYFSAASAAFQSVQTYLNSSDSLLAKTNIKKQVYSFLLIGKDRIETYSNIPTYGIVLKDNIIQAFTDHIDDKSTQTFFQFYNITDDRRNKNNIIIFGCKIITFKNVPLLSDLTSDDYELKLQEYQQQKEICQNSIYDDTQNYLSSYFTQFNGMIQESYSPCGYVIKFKQ
ncbi:hypothetical protein ABPG74_009231 [Tetrahymena malaccensis]